MLNAATAALIAHVGFWGLLGFGWIRQEIGARGVLLWLILWSAVYFGIAAAAPIAVVPALAVIDIALVLIIFKGDIRF